MTAASPDDLQAGLSSAQFSESIGRRTYDGFRKRDHGNALGALDRVHNIVWLAFGAFGGAGAVVGWCLRGLLT